MMLYHYNWHSGRMSASNKHNSQPENPSPLKSKFSTTLKGVLQMPQKLTPLHDRILIRRVEEAETLRGGIIIPDTAKEKPQEGVIVAVGTGRHEKGQTIPLAVKEGDRVLFGKYAGSEIKIDGEELLILKEDEVFGILTGAAKTAEKVGAGKR
jgi:chaperonin GroES